MTPTHPVMVCRLKAESCQGRNYPVQPILLSNLIFSLQVLTVIVGSPACADHRDSTVRSTKGIRTPPCERNICGSIPSLPHQHPHHPLMWGPLSHHYLLILLMVPVHLYLPPAPLPHTKSALHERKKERKGGREGMREGGREEGREGGRKPHTHSY